ncbi:MAG: hypothetical protein NT075_09725 [Chloroflexi bacterium]|nr:hypothetical protein [Chloroflexota bacterium]
MPHQNRVTPFGEIIATRARGTLMGNRGCLHDSQGHIRRRYKTLRWIICQLEFKGVHRTIMTPGLWTELFFLDEATALAAGHRPCAYCQRARFELFRELWAAANPALANGPRPAAPVIDTALHAERITAMGQKVSYVAMLRELPTGTMVSMDKGEQAFLVYQTWLLPWQPAGYGAPMVCSPTEKLQVLTPYSIVQTLAAGYPVTLHTTVLA